MTEESASSTVSLSAPAASIGSSDAPPPPPQAASKTAAHADDSAPNEIRLNVNVITLVLPCCVNRC
ncbi:hypothetical protein E4K72_13195 [Oxalobacteraceae bacterium OM1]|nr:hypothetical protein E4K72_13195 [Oxalobacteraceae bacterium OM1]